MRDATIVLVPGLRGHVEDHWQTRLAASLPGASMVTPLGRTFPGLQSRVTLLDQAVRHASGPVILVAHSAGVLVTAHWAARYSPTRVVGALLATPATLAAELPAEYPSIGELRAHGWLPIPRERLPFPSIVAASSNDPLANSVRLAGLAAAWGSRVHDLGAVGHLNPASGFGEWPAAVELIDHLRDGAVERDLDGSRFCRVLELARA
jgi:predicted alpha/beta hydrolase family esterase